MALDQSDNGGYNSNAVNDEPVPACDRIPQWMEEAVGARFKELQNTYRQQNYFKMKLSKLRRLKQTGKYPKTINNLSAPALKLPSTTPCYYRVEKSYLAALETYKTACLEALMEGLEEEVRVVEKSIDFESWSISVYNEVSDSLSGNYVMPQEYLGRTMQDLKIYLDKLKSCWTLFMERIEGESKRKEEESIKNAAKEDIEAMAEAKHVREKYWKKRRSNDHPQPQRFDHKSQTASFIPKMSPMHSSPYGNYPPQSPMINPYMPSPRVHPPPPQSPRMPPQSPQVNHSFQMPSQTPAYPPQTPAYPNQVPPSPRYPPPSPRHVPPPPASPRNPPPQQSPRHAPPPPPSPNHYPKYF